MITEIYIEDNRLDLSKDLSSEFTSITLQQIMWVTTLTQPSQQVVLFM